ncbi:MAG: hypothetical protein ABR520_11950 [Mycobacteriales bacterium]|nr:hypothetical protein [Frankia sp.]
MARAAPAGEPPARRAADLAAMNAPPPPDADPAPRLRRLCAYCGGEVTVAADSTRCPLGHPLRATDAPSPPAVRRKGWLRRKPD